MITANLTGLIFTTDAGINESWLHWAGEHNAHIGCKVMLAMQGLASYYKPKISRVARHMTIPMLGKRVANGQECLWWMHEWAMIGCTFMNLVTSRHDNLSIVVIPKLPCWQPQKRGDCNDKSCGKFHARLTRFMNPTANTGHLLGLVHPSQWSVGQTLS